MKAATFAWLRLRLLTSRFVCADEYQLNKVPHGCVKWNQINGQKYTGIEEVVKIFFSSLNLATFGHNLERHNMRNQADQNLIAKSQKLPPFSRFRRLRPAARLPFNCPTFPVWQAFPLNEGVCWESSGEWSMDVTCGTLGQFHRTRCFVCVWKSLQWWTRVFFAGSNGGQAAAFRWMNVCVGSGASHLPWRRQCSWHVCIHTIVQAWQSSHKLTSILTHSPCLHVVIPIVATCCQIPRACDTVKRRKDQIWWIHCRDFPEVTIHLFL